ncbi:type II toxin-antitoxin system VapC family toxin [Candidatus Palauibacter sp.]|uniref:type II toxin-antitoxin system VapC family toxin n=1 Tax=Candidatus Palauibacter sp. TaxID=3101350 RepID=UPI003B529F10
MRVLLDTSYLYDLMEAPGQFREPERRFLAARDVRIHVSAVSIWEMRLKHHARHPSGARKSRFAPNDVVAALEDQNVTFLPMTILHAAQALEPPLEPPLDHKDPFDELLLVHARREGLRLLTADRRLARHPLAIAAEGLG